jgi:hypothetical protein
MAIVTTITKIFKKVLTIGIPPDDDVLYSKVVKRKIPDKSAEALVVEDFKNAIHHVKSKILNTTPPNKAEKETTVKRSTSSKKTGTDKKTSVKKIKSKTETSKKIPAKKVSTKKDTGTKTVTKKKTKTSTTKKTTTKKMDVSTKKPTSEKITEAKKSTVTKTKGTKKEAKIALYTKDIKKHYGKVDETFLEIIVKNLGPSIYRKDAELVSCSDPKELDTVRRNFLIKKLGITLSKEKLDIAIQEVCQELKGVRTKYRATFYYRLAQKFKKESVLN